MASLLQSSESNPYVILWNHKILLIFACLGIQLSILETLTIGIKEKDQTQKPQRTAFWISGRV